MIPSMLLQPRVSRPNLALRRFHASRSVLSGLPSRSATLAKFNFPPATHTVGQISTDVDRFLDLDNVVLHGHLNRKPRVMAKNSFAELRDTSGRTVQLTLLPGSTSEESFDAVKTSTAEESVSVTGRVQLKHSSSGQKEWELLVSNYQVLNKSNLDAARLENLKQTNPADLPPKFRYLQLRTPFYQHNLRTRSKVASLVRKVLSDEHDFVEIETPLLFKSTPEGAREFLVPTRSYDSFYALPQSPQQYKQILMSSGFTRYFQIAKCFRDEDLRADRQPEFTQIDLEMSFINNSDQVGLVIEDVVHNVWNKVAKVPTYSVNASGNLTKIEDYSEKKLHFAKLDYIDALALYGIDKPDLRSSISFTNLSEFFRPTKNPQFPVLEACVLKKAFDPSKKYKLPKSLTDMHNYSARRPYILPIKDEDSAQNWYKTFVDKSVIETAPTFSPETLHSVLKLEPGDILAFSDRAELSYENPTPLGKFRQLAITEFPDKWNRPIQSANGSVTTDYKSADVVVGAWVVNFPLFNPVEVDNDSGYPIYDFNKYESTHHPFTMAKTEDYELLEIDPLKVRGEHYDLVMNGVEVGGGSRRIHDSDLQRYIFEKVLRIHNYEDLFGHLLHALSMGCPPHAGIALGFDRLCAMIVGSPSIRDVIAFPKNQSGVDPVVESPTGVSQKVLDEYFIATKQQTT